MGALDADATENSDIDGSASRKMPTSSPEPPSTKRELSYDSSMPEEGLSLGELNTDFDEEAEEESDDDSDGVKLCIYDKDEIFMMVQSWGITMMLCWWMQSDSDDDGPCRLSMDASVSNYSAGDKPPLGLPSEASMMTTATNE